MIVVQFHATEHIIFPSVALTLATPTFTPLTSILSSGCQSRRIHFEAKSFSNTAEQYQRCDRVLILTNFISSNGSFCFMQSPHYRLGKPTPAAITLLFAVMESVPSPLLLWVDFRDEPIITNQQTIRRIHGKIFHHTSRKGQIPTFDRNS